MKEDKSEYTNKQRTSFWWASLLWCLLLVLAYFGVDIIEKGKVLNEMTSYPIWGYVLWALIAVALWVLFIGPVIHFCNLRYVGMESLRRQVLRAGNAVRDYRDEPEDSELRQIADEFSAAPRDFNSLEGKNGWQELLARFREAVHGRAHDTILGYCKAAGVGMVFAFNGLLDGLVLLAIQVRLVVLLARVFGYKPGAFFNAYFFGWIVVNSLVFALCCGLMESLAASAVSTMLGSAQGADIGTVRAGLQWVLEVLIQALTAGVLVYASGRIFLWRLEYEGREVALKMLLKLRADGRRDYALKMKGARAALGLSEPEGGKPSSEVADKLMQLFGYGAGGESALSLPGSMSAAPQPVPLPRAQEESPATPLPESKVISEPALAASPAAVSAVLPVALSEPAAPLPAALPAKAVEAVEEAKDGGNS